MMGDTDKPLITAAMIKCNQVKRIFDLRTHNVRESGVELLRIVAMLMVLAIHANYWRIGVPSSADIEHGGGAVFVRILLQMLSSPCVDVFVIVSGYFSIRPKLKSVAGLWFLLAFWNFIADVPYNLYATGHVNILMAVRHMVFPFVGWFIPAYLGLYLISPILNAYALSCERRTFARYLLLAFSLQFFFDIVYPRWSIFDHTIFNGGHSVLSFALLYLLGRFIRRYGERFERIKSRHWFLFYIVVFTTWTSVRFLLLILGLPRQLTEYVMQRGASYVNPLVILGSLFLFFTFKSMKFSNSTVNHIATSVLGVFCFQSLPFYEKVVKWAFSAHEGVSVLAIDAGIIGFVYVAGTVIDQVRIAMWKIGYGVVAKFNNKVSV